MSIKNSSLLFCCLLFSDTLFDHPKGKVLRQLHIQDGTLGSPIFIECAMVEQIKVNNGNLYYLESGREVAAHNRVLKKVSLTKF